MNLLEGLHQRFGHGALAEFLPGGFAHDFAAPEADIATPYCVTEDAGGVNEISSEPGQGPTDQDISFSFVGEDSDKTMLAAKELKSQLDADPVIQLPSGGTAYAMQKTPPRLVTDPEVTKQVVDMSIIAMTWTFQM